jgi:hypothetical protein
MNLKTEVQRETIFYQLEISLNTCLVSTFIIVCAAVGSQGCVEEGRHAEWGGGVHLVVSVHRALCLEHTTGATLQMAVGGRGLRGWSQHWGVPSDGTDVQQGDHVVAARANHVLS